MAQHVGNWLSNGWWLLVLAVLLCASFLALGAIHGEFAMVLLIGTCGAIGGALSAATSGTLTFPLVTTNPAGMSLGSMRELFFGSVGAYVIMMITPGVSEDALALGPRYREALSFGNDAAVTEGNDEATQSRTPNAKTGIGKGTRGSTTKRGELATDPKPQLDLLEVIALALVGGYGGRWIIVNSLSQFLSQDQIKGIHNELHASVHRLEVQKVNDDRAIKVFDDQIDLSTPAPEADDLRNAIVAASTEIHARIYVRARAAFNSVRREEELRLEVADLRRSVELSNLNQGQAGASLPTGDRAEEAKRRLRPLAERILPVMKCLVEIDEERRYSGCRYGVALAYHYLGQHQQALDSVRDAISIAERDTRKTQERRAQVLQEYKATERDILAEMGRAAQATAAS